MQQLIEQAMHYMQFQQFGKALSICKKIIASGYNHPQVHMIMAIALGQTNKFNESKKVFTKLIQHFPKNPEIYYNYALILQNSNKSNVALQQYNKCIELNPRHFSALNNAGSLELKNKNTIRALKLFQKAYDLQPFNLDYLRNLIEVHYQMGRYLECITLLNPILNSPDVNEQDYILAIDAMYKGRKPSSALQTYKKALIKYPDSAELLNLAGLIETDNKKYKLANDYLLKAVNISSDNYEYQINQLTTLSHFTDNQGDILEKLEGLVQRYTNRIELLEFAASLCENLSLSKQAKEYIKKGLKLEPQNPRLLLTKAKLHVFNKQFKKAMKALTKIDVQACSKNTKIEVAYEKARLFDKRKKFKKAWAAIKSANSINQSELNIQNSAQSFVMNSKQLIDDFNTNYKINTIDTSQSNDDSRFVFVIGFPRSGTTLLERILSSHPQVQILEETNAVNDIYQKVNENQTGSYFQRLSKLTQAEMNQLKQSYINSIGGYTDWNKSDIIVDKMPMNVNHLALIKQLFPHALIIMTLRHPLDVCISCLMQNMLQVFSFKSAAKVYDSYMEVLQVYQSKLELNIHSIKYEDLIADKNSIIKDVLSRINLPWDDAMDKHHNNVTRVNTPSYQQVNQPIYQDAKYRFQNYLTYIKTDVEILEKWMEIYKYKI